MRDEQEFLSEVIARANKKKAKRRAYTSILAVCICIAVTAVALPLLKHSDENTAPPEADDSQISSVAMEHFACVQFFINADRYCKADDQLKAEVSNNASTSSTKNEADSDVVADQNNANAYPAYAFQTQNMVGEYTLTENGFEVTITNAEGEQKKYALEGDTLTANDGESALLTEQQINLLKNILGIAE